MIEGSIFNLRRIFLILGTACNFNCVYCVQHENKPRCVNSVSQAVMDWLDDIAYQMPMSFKPTIVFYGGEPLLYKKSIHEIIDRFGDLFSYAIVTNGAYLTDEDVNYFNTNCVSVTFSWDGPNTELTRQVDLWKDDDFVELFNRLEDRSIGTVYSSVNQDLLKTLECIDCKSPGTNVVVEDLICNSYTPSSIVSFDKDILLRNYLIMGNQTEAHWIGTGEHTSGAKIFEHWLKSAIRCFSKMDFPTYSDCGAGCSTLSVDTQGTVYLCKNFNLKIGTISDSYETLSRRAKEETKILRDKHLEAKGCFECPAFFFCHGGCPFEEPSDTQKSKCEMLKTRWASIVSFIDNRLEVNKQ